MHNEPDKETLITYGSIIAIISMGSLVINAAVRSEVLVADSSFT